MAMIHYTVFNWLYGIFLHSQLTGNGQLEFAIADISRTRGS